MCMYLCVIWLCSDAYQYESYGQPGAEAAGYGGYGKYLLLTVSIPYLHKHVLNGLVMCALVAEEIIIILTVVCLQCFDAVGWAAGRASGL